MRSLLARNPSLYGGDLDDDIYWGCVPANAEREAPAKPSSQRRAAGRNSHSVPAVTVNRLCGSSMRALHDRANDHDGDAQVCLVGGVGAWGVPMSHGVDFRGSPGRSVAKRQG